MPDSGQLRTISLDVGGMHCAGCAASVERALRAASGVADARVNLAVERADIDVADGGASPADLEHAVITAGYRATARTAGRAAAEARRMEKRAEADAEARRDRMHLIVAGILTAPLLAQMIPMAFGSPMHIPGWIQALLAAPVQFWIGARFYRGAWTSMKSHAPGMDILVALGTSAAYGCSLAVVFGFGPADAGLYFEGAAAVILFVVLGKTLESRARRNAVQGLEALLALRPNEAHRVLADGSTETIAADAVQAGDILLIRPGERAPVDGIIVDGLSEFDESLVTGESLALPKGTGDRLAEGAVNGSGMVRLEATRVGEDGTIARIARLVEAAEGAQAPTQRLVDQISAVFAPVVLALAALAFTGWLIIDGDLEHAIVAAVSTLVIACPCALGLAAPAAIAAGVDAAARAGLLIRDFEAAERAGSIRAITFDKTGTLTEGTPKLVSKTPAPGFAADDILRLAASAQAGSEHPLAQATVDAAGGAAQPPESFEARPGQGLVAKVQGQTIAIGSTNLMVAEGVIVDMLDAAVATAAEGGCSIAFVAVDGALAGLLAFRDEPRSEAAAAIQAVRDAGLTPVMISGDNPAAVAVIAKRLGLTDARAGVAPDMKAAAIRELQAQHGGVAFVGDGVNDAPALAAADLGIAMGSGADAAISAADITLLQPDPRLAPAALDIAARIRAKVRQNLFWAFAYNTVGLPLAMLGYLTPAFAGLAMALSSVSVVGNALLLRRWKARL